MENICCYLSCGSLISFSRKRDKHCKPCPLIPTGPPPLRQVIGPSRDISLEPDLPCVALQMWMSVKVPGTAALEANVRTQKVPTNASAPGASSWPMAPRVRVSTPSLPIRKELGAVSICRGEGIPRDALPPHPVSADVDECAGEEEHCAPHGECLNSQGSFFCLCAPGFVSAEGGTRCQGKTSVWSCLRSASTGIRGLCLQSHLNTLTEVNSLLAPYPGRRQWEGWGGVEDPGL